MAFDVQGLSLSFGEREILHDVSVRIEEGKRTAIIGPNGVGKSTFLRTLAGMERHFAGKVLLSSVEVAKTDRKELAKILALLPQGMTAPADLTVEQLVDYGRFPYRFWYRANDGAADKRAVEAAIEETGLESFRKRRVMSLSGGERQRAWIAMALAQEPKILLLDEPTTYLDIAHQLEVMKIIEKLNREKGMTILMVLHDINHALQFADEILVIFDGGIYAQGSPEEVLTVSMLEEVFGVRADIFRNSEGRSVLSPISLTDSP